MKIKKFTISKEALIEERKIHGFTNKFAKPINKVLRSKLNRLQKNPNFINFFDDKLDKRLQYAEINELLVFLFGSVKRGLEIYELEKNYWENK